MGLGNIFKRRLKVFTLAMVVYLDYKATQNRVKWAKNDKKSIIWKKTHERNAKRMLNLIIELEGLWVKLGQYLSTRADVLPIQYINLLRQLQDSLPPRPLYEVKKTIATSLGKSVDELFSNFDETPLATASIAQVHRATLNTGREVVVKVQHAGIKEVILEDLKNAKSIIDWIAWAEPQYDFNQTIDEWCREVPKELDFNHEAENTRSVSKNLGCRSTDDGMESKANHVDVLIPEVIQSSENVLVLEFMDGIRLNDHESLEAFGIDKQKVVEEITRAYSHQIYVDGFFNGDPHPGNFLVNKEPPHHPILLDFGLTKSISSSIKQAFAKMFLSSAEGDHVALLSAFAEMGLKLRLDMPEQLMGIMNMIFRSTTPASEASETMKAMTEQRTKNLKVIQEKMNLSKKEMARFNPVDAFPGDAVIFFRVLNLLRGLSSSLNVRIVYLEVMRPFAEATLKGSIMPGPVVNSQWIHNSQIHSHVESKLRDLLLEHGKNNSVLGIQVCAYKDGEVIIDTSAGVLGRYDPRPVQPDSLFPIFSTTKGITAGLLHWLVDKRKLKFEQTIANIWPEFETNKKELIKVHHVLNHTSGLHNAMGDIMKTSPLSICDWDESLDRMTVSTPATEPGSEQHYHYLSFGWLCGGIIEYASGKKFQEMLEEVIVRPLGIEGELYIGIAPGVETRLATLTVDIDDIKSKLSAYNTRPELPDGQNLVEIASGLPVLFNTLNIRRAIIPAANGHCSARALARYYAALATGGIAPPKHSSFSSPPLGSHPHIPNFPTKPSRKKERSSNNGIKKEINGKSGSIKRSNSFMNCTGGSGTCRSVGINGNNHGIEERSDDEISNDTAKKMFDNPNIHDAFMGVGDYANMVHPDGKFGLGFRRFNTSGDDRQLSCFGHSGIGGSTGFCDTEHNFAIAVTVNKMSFGRVTRSIIQLVCSELNIPIPQEFSPDGDRGPDMQMNLNLYS